jgi:hypothetical protein
MRRRVAVELTVGDRTLATDVEASVLAVDDVLVEMARQQLGVSPDQFDAGQVVEP